MEEEEDKEEEVIEVQDDEEDEEDLMDGKEDDEDSADTAAEYSFGGRAAEDQDAYMSEGSAYPTKQDNPASVSGYHTPVGSDY